MRLGSNWHRGREKEARDLTSVVWFLDEASSDRRQYSCDLFLCCPISFDFCGSVCLLSLVALVT